MEGDGCKNDELNEKADQVKSYEEAILIVKEQETITIVKYTKEKEKYTKC